jgi:hypothetical protein
MSFLKAGRIGLLLLTNVRIGIQKIRQKQQKMAFNRVVAHLYSPLMNTNRIHNF